MPSFVVIEEDFTDSKAHTYPRRRSHTIGSSNAEFHDVKKMNLLLLNENESITVFGHTLGFSSTDLRKV